VRGEPDNLPRPDQFAGFFHMDIVLTHMQTIGAGFYYNFWVVIDDQRNPKAFADRSSFAKVCGFQ
jgi:hypothetical protein